MKKAAIYSLLAVNAALIVALVPSFSLPHAEAQARRPGEFVLIPGIAQGASVEVVYVLDVTNGRLGAIAPGDNNQLTSMPRLDLGQIFDQAMQRGNNPGRR